MKQLPTTIFRRIMNWLDSWDDWFNPITVRELRILIYWKIEITILLFLFIITVTDVFVLYTIESKQHLFSIPIFLSLSHILVGLGIMESKQHLFSIPILLSLSHILVGLGIIGTLVRARCNDELLSIVPLSPQQQVYGYWAFSCIQSIFLNSIYLPFIAIGQLLEPASYVLLFIPFVSFFLTQIATLISLSISARIKQQWEKNFLGFTIFFILGFIAAPWFYVIYFATSCWQPLAWNRGFGFVSLFILLPIALLLLGYIAYKLAIYGFKTWRKPFGRALLLNIVIYTLFNIIAAALWLGLAALVL